jgi:hypothetical protein
MHHVHILSNGLNQTLKKKKTKKTCHIPVKNKVLEECAWCHSSYYLQEVV